MSIQLEQICVPKFFHDGQCTIAETSLARDGHHGIVMTIDKLHWSLNTGDQSFSFRNLIEGLTKCFSLLKKTWKKYF